MKTILFWFSSGQEIWLWSYSSRLAEEFRLPKEFSFSRSHPQHQHQHNQNITSIKTDWQLRLFSTSAVRCSQCPFYLYLGSDFENGSCWLHGFQSIPSVVQYSFQSFRINLVDCDAITLLPRSMYISPVTNTIQFFQFPKSMLLLFKLWSNIASHNLQRPPPCLVSLALLGHAINISKHDLELDIP